MLLALSIIGFFLSLILFYFNFSKYPTIHYLAGFFLLISLYYLNQYILFFSQSVLLVSIFYLNFVFLYYLMGPMFYWYIRSILTDNARLKKSDLLHFIPVLFFFVITFPYILSPWSEKIGIAIRITEDVSNLSLYQPADLLQHFPWWMIYLCNPVLLIGYMVWASILFISYIRKGAPTVFARQLFVKKWIPVLFIGLFVYVITHTLMMLEVVFSESFEVFKSVNVLQIISAMGITGLLISPFFFPDTLYGLPRIPDSMTTMNSLTVRKEHSPEEHKKQIPGFEYNYLLAIQQKAEYCMKELKPYLQEDCNLANFAKLIKIPAHHLAFYFREEKKQSYNDYRNKWRIDHAKSLIREGKAKEVTLDEIGYLSGFSSRNAFFSAFRKFEGTSPGGYAAQFNE